MERSDLQKVLNGLNVILVEAMINYEAYLKILGMNKVVNGERVPISLFVLAKSHWQIYVIEITKLLIHEEKNIFTLKNTFNKIIPYYNLDISFKSEFQKLSKDYKYEIERIRKIRNSLFAHTDPNYNAFKLNVDSNRLTTFNTSLLNIVRKINEQSDLEHYRFDKSVPIGISSFYDLIEENIINNNIHKDIPTDIYKF